MLQTILNAVWELLKRFVFWLKRKLIDEDGNWSEWVWEQLPEYVAEPIEPFVNSLSIINFYFPLAETFVAVIAATTWWATVIALKLLWKHIPFMGA